MNGRYLELIIYRALAELRSEASRVYLGALWWVLEPILYMLVFYLVFGLGFRHGDEGFVAFLLCGLIPWKWLDGTVRAASGSVSTAVGLMQQVYLPKIVLPLIVLTTNTIKFLIVCSLLLVFLWLDGSASVQTWYWLPFVVIAQLVMVASLSCLAAALVPVVPDLKFVISNGMTMLFFMSGIFYKTEYMDAQIQQWLSYNPVVVLIESYRNVLLDGIMPAWGALSAATSQMLVCGLLAALLFQRLDRYYPRVAG